MKIEERVVAGGTEDFMTVRHLTIHGTNFEIGRHMGELAIERFGQSPADFASNPLYARARRLYIQRNYPVHWERMRGVAAAFGVDAEDDRYDLTGIKYNIDLPRLPGCSVVSYPPATTSTGGGYLSRNYDFFLGSLADIFQMPLPQEAKAQMRPLMQDPYIMEWYPDDGGYASLATHSFDFLAGTLDGINSEGLAVSMMADGEAGAELGPRLEPHIGPIQTIGLHELQVLRLLLDTCATADEAKEALLLAKQFYRLMPCHYLIADKAGNSFIYENSTGRNAQHVIEGTGVPQVCTNHQVYRHPLEAIPGGAPTMETESFWRFRTLTERIATHDGLFTTDDMKGNNACVSYLGVLDTMRADPSQAAAAAAVTTRTLWHALYDQEAGAVEFSFYLGDERNPDGSRTERRSDYLKFALNGS